MKHTLQPPRGAPQPQGAHGSLSAPASPAVSHVANGRISPAPAVPPHRVAIAEPPLSHTVSLHDRRLWYRSGASSAARHAPGGPRRGGARGAPPSLIKGPLSLLATRSRYAAVLVPSQSFDWRQAATPVLGTDLRTLGGHRSHDMSEACARAHDARSSSAGGRDHRSHERSRHCLHCVSR